MAVVCLFLLLRELRSLIITGQEGSKVHYGDTSVPSHPMSEINWHIDLKGHFCSLWGLSNKIYII